MDLPGHCLCVGDVGTVVHVYRDGLAYEAEFFALDGTTVAVTTVEAVQVCPVTGGGGAYGDQGPRLGYLAAATPAVSGWVECL